MLSNEQLQEAISGYIPAHEAAHRLRVTSAMVACWFSDGRLVGVRTKYGVLLDPDDVERLRQEREIKPPRPGRPRKEAAGAR